MFFTEGDTRWIKRHTQKSLKELNNMKPTKPVKKKPAKRKPLHGFKNELIAKLMNLKYRLNDAYHLRDMDTKDDKSYVMNLIDDVRTNHLTKLCKEDMLKCNALWKTYE
jgi:hypothetical protein|tara:strand:- start:38 stop:364 length:327 start_codon:yes stop_codon:yes gene_type:complete